MTERASNAIDHLIDAHEGGYVHDSDDLGGETKYGISKRSYPNLDIAGLTREDAKQIYHRDFWQPWDIEAFPPRIGEKFFETLVNMPPREAVKILQGGLRATVDYNLATDGIMGPKTRQALHKIIGRGTTEATLAAMRSEQAGYYRRLVTANPNQLKFLTGWLRRAYA